MLEHDDLTAEASGSPGTKQARGRERRSAIIDAAALLFAEQGVAGTSIAAVARQVGITDAGLLYHFPTKEDLVLAVLRGRDAENADAAFPSRNADPLGALRAAGEWGKVMEQDEAFTRLHVMLSAEHLVDTSPLHQYFRDRYERVHAEIVGLIGRLQEQGKIRADVDADAEATALLAIQDGARLQWFYSDRQTSIADTVRRYVAQTIDRLTDA